MKYTVGEHMKIMKRAMQIDRLWAFMVTIALLLPVVLHHAATGPLSRTIISMDTPVGAAIAASGGIPTLSPARMSDTYDQACQAVMTDRFSACPALPKMDSWAHQSPDHTVAAQGVRVVTTCAAARARPPTVRRALLHVFLL